MTFELDIDAERWRRGLQAVVENTPGIVPVIKGNGYGLGRDLLASEAKDLGVDVIAVGTYAEVPAALAAFGGDVMVLTPWRPFLTDVIHDERVIRGAQRRRCGDPPIIAPQSVRAGGAARRSAERR